MKLRFWRRSKTRYLSVKDLGPRTQLQVMAVLLISGGAIIDKDGFYKELPPEERTRL